MKKTKQASINAVLNPPNCVFGGRGEGWGGGKKPKTSPTLVITKLINAWNGGDNLKSSIGRKAISYCATVAQISLSRCRMSLILIPRNRRYTANKNKKRHFSWSSFLTVKQVHLEMIYHYQWLWLATSVSRHLWAGFSVLDVHAPDLWASFSFNNVFETF